MDENTSLELMMRTALPIDDVDRLQMGPNEGITIIWVNLFDRPDLQLLEEKAPQPSGFAVCTWFYGNQGQRNMIVGLRVEMKQPTRYAFQIVLKVETYLEQLTLLAQSGKLWVVSGPPPKHLVGNIAMDARTFLQKVAAYRGDGLFIELEPHLITELQEQLAAWKRNR